MTTDLHPAQLLDDYTASARRKNPESLVSTVIRTKSLEARRILAHLVASPQVPLETILAAARNKSAERELFKAHQINCNVLAKLARTLICSPIEEGDFDLGRAVYAMAYRRGGPESFAERDQCVHVELAMLAGKADQARQLLERFNLLGSHVRRSIELDLARPWEGGGDAERWAYLLSEVVPEPVPLVRPASPGTLFDGLATADAPEVDSPHKVSVIITTFKRGLPLLTSLRSVLRQTWQNFEVLIVDDASGPEFDEVLDECEAMDERVRVIRLTENGGSYRARSIGLSEAEGEFVAVQDSDDWWHPRHLELQMQPFAERPELVGTISRSAVFTEDMRATRLLRVPVLLCSSSLLIRREPVLEKVGYWDHIRKAADNEYLGRIESAFGRRAVQRLDAVLTLVRTGVSSLSSADYGSGWKHPARQSYHSAYHHWHELIRDGAADPYVSRDGQAPIFHPHRFRIEPGPTDYDVVYAGDWVNYGGPQKSMINEIRACLGAGLRVGIMHFTPLRFIRVADADLNPEIQRMLNDGLVDQLVPTDEARTRLTVLRYPPILQFPQAGRCAIETERLVILANQPPTEADGRDLRYTVEACERHAEQMFGVAAEWVPQGPHVRHALEPLMGPDSVMHDFDMPGVVDTDEWCFPRTGFRGSVPVIGRHTRDNHMKWPESPRILRMVYPIDDRADVRIMGGAERALQVLKRKRPPLNWVVFQYDEMGVREFLYGLDFYLYFPHSQRIEAFGRSILEAIASGCVTILPPHFEEVFGQGAVYCEPEEAGELVAALRADPEEYLRLSKAAQEHVRLHFSYRSYLDRLERLGIAATAGV